MANYERFVDLSYKPKKTDVIAVFKVKVPSWSTPKRCFGAVAAESSVGTWSNLDIKKTHPHVLKVAAKVYKSKKIGNRRYLIHIAYPEDHFEQGNMGQILASIAGNVFGMKAADELRLEDIEFTKNIMKKYKGPKFGMNGIRKFMKVKKRPILLSVPKPKVGMTTKEHSQIGYDIWTGGLDLLKDDENLTNQKFNPFEKRLKMCMKYRDKAEKETGDRKSYLLNISGPTVKEMEKRAKLAADYGNEFAMIDIITCGWTAVSSMREICGDLGLAIHAHRAMHGSFTRNINHGFNMNCVSKLSRMLGVDQLHIGTGVGKLVSPKDEVIQLRNQLTDKKLKENKHQDTLKQDWGNIKPVFPVSSGGLHPGILANVMDFLGTDIELQIGGGCHGHPWGSNAGAIASSAAVEAYLEGKKLEEKAEEYEELAMALKNWGHSKTR